MMHSERLHIVILLLIMIGLTACGREDHESPCGDGYGDCFIDPFFTIPDTAKISEPITPNNQTLGAINYEWDFGDGSSLYRSQTLAGPTHEFLYAGIYQVKLTAYCCQKFEGSYDDYQMEIVIVKE